jgi:hypothetical protein
MPTINKKKEKEGKKKKRLKNETQKGAKLKNSH